MKYLILILSVAAFVHSVPVSQGESVLRSFMDNFVKCVNSDTDMCLKEHGLKLVEGIRSARNLKIWEGVNLINNSPKEGRSLDTLSTDPEVRGRQLSENLWSKAADVLQNSELELSYADDTEADESRALDDVEESRGKKKKAIKKKLKILIPLMILAKAKAVALVVLALVVIAASLFKIALLAKIAFIIKVIALIKALLAKKHAQEETWEVPHGWEPHGSEHAHVEHGHGWEGGWSRSRTEANNLAYSGYNN